MIHRPRSPRPAAPHPAKPRPAWLAAACAVVLTVGGAATPEAAAPEPARTPAPATSPAPVIPGTDFPYPGDVVRSKGPGRVRLVEVARSHEGGQFEVDYRIESSGFPRGPVFHLVYARLGSPVELLCQGLVADSTGSLVPARHPGPPDPADCPPFAAMQLGATNYLPGEPYRVAAVSENDSLRAVATAFPVAIEAADGPCQLLLELASADGLSFTVWGAGFDPDEQPRTRITQGDETLEGGIFCDAKGTFRVALRTPPGPTGGGTATYEVIGRSGRPRLTFRWGQALGSAP